MYLVVAVPVRHDQRPARVPLARVDAALCHVAGAEHDGGDLGRVVGGGRAGATEAADQGHLNLIWR